MFVSGALLIILGEPKHDQDYELQQAFTSTMTNQKSLLEISKQQAINDPLLGQKRVHGREAGSTKNRHRYDTDDDLFTLGGNN